MQSEMSSKAGRNPARTAGRLKDSKRLCLRKERRAFPGDGGAGYIERQIMHAIIRGFTCAALASCLLSQPLRAGDAVSGNLVISQAWSRATPNGAKVAGGYLTIENCGTSPDRLLSGSTELAKRLEMHEMTVNDGVMAMRPGEDALSVATGRNGEFGP